jgi:hypothetical protein
LYKILFSSQGAHFLVNRVRELIAERTIIQIKEQFPEEKLLAPVEIIANHIASAQIGLVVWWLENDKPYPAAYMAQVSLWLSIAGSARGYGAEAFPLAPPPIPDNKTF